MNDLQQQNNAPTLATPQGRQAWVGWLCETQINHLLSEHFTEAQFTQVVLGEFNKTPKLRGCSFDSIAFALIQCATLGLMPSSGLGHAYLIPYGADCTLQIGYKGYLQLLHASGLFKAASASAVYRGEDFRYDAASGQRPSHPYSFDVDRSDEHVVGAYCVVEMMTGGIACAVLSRGQIEARRDRGGYRPGKRSPWDTDFGAMARKTAVRALLAGGTVPLTQQLEVAMSIEAAADRGPVDATSLPPGLRTEDRGNVITLDGQLAGGDEDTRDEPLPFDLRADPPGPKDLRDLVRLGGMTITARAIGTWTKQQAKAAESWAVAEENRRRGYHPDDRNVHAGNVPLPDHMAPSEHEE